MSGWGSGGWGTSPWGGGSGGFVLSFVSALATSERTVFVMLSGEALALTPLTVGDALNPSTWQVETLDGLGATVRTLTVLATRPVLGNLGFELYTLEKFDSYLVTHVVKSTTLLSATRVLVGLPNSAEFPGVVADRSSLARQAPSLRDIQNHPHSSQELSGAFNITAAGDYQTEEGVALLRKLIIRRLTTTPGEFFHLDPQNYGIGLRLKEPLTISDIPKLQVEVQRQVQLEPEVDAATARVTLNRQGILTIALRVRLKSAQEVPIEFQLPTSLVQL